MALPTNLPSVRAFVQSCLHPEDPTVAAILWGLMLATLAGLYFVPGLADGSAGDDREAVLKGAGGVIIVLGSYFAARTLKQTRTDQRASRMLQAIELVAHDDLVVRVGAVGVLKSLADSAERRHEADVVEVILQVLNAARARDPEPRARDAADVAYQTIASKSAARPNAGYGHRRVDGP